MDLLRNVYKGEKKELIEREAKSLKVSNKAESASVGDTRISTKS